LILRPNFSQLRLEILRSSISFFDLSLFFASWFQILSSSTWFFELRFFPNSPQILCDPPLDSSSFAGWIWMWSRMRILDQEWRAHFIIHPWGRPGPPERVCLQEGGWFCLSGHGTKSGNEIGLSIIIVKLKKFQERNFRWQAQVTKPRCGINTIRYQVNEGRVCRWQSTGGVWRTQRRSIMWMRFLSKWKYCCRLKHPESFEPEFH
jgi:hypothetical protein